MAAKTTPIVSEIHEVEDLIVQNMSIVERILHHSYGTMDFNIKEELRSEGYLGLIWAATHFNPKRKIRFNTYASKRIHGMMQDWLRMQAGHHARADKRKASICQQPDLKTHEGSYEWVNVEAYTNPVTGNSIRKIGIDLKYYLREFMSHDQVDVFIEYYIEGKSMQSISEKLGVTISRVCQVIRKVEKAQVINFMIDRVA